MCNITFITFRSLIFWIIKGIRLLEWKNWWDKSVNRKFSFTRHRAKWLFIERGRSMTGHSIGLAEAPWWSPDPVSGSAAYKILVSFISWSAGRDWFSNKRWLDQYQNEWRATGTPWILARPSWHHVLFAFMYSPRAFAFTAAIFVWRVVCAQASPDLSTLGETGLIMRVTSRMDNAPRFLHCTPYILIFVI